MLSLFCPSVHRGSLSRNVPGQAGGGVLLGGGSDGKEGPYKGPVRKDWIRRTCQEGAPPPSPPLDMSPSHGQV